MRSLISKSILLTAALVAVQAANQTTDKMTNLPDAAPLPTEWYSGFLEVTSTKSLHYVFIKSLDKPATDPVLIWFNGGPGCSSLLGLMQEHGPFVFDDGETVLKPNPWPWNYRANMLYIENPAAVGYSYAGTPDDALHSDVSQSEDVFVALQNWYQAFPEFRNNSLFITGESYAGVYAPYLAWQIHEWNLVQNMHGWNDTYNLAGFIVGNGQTNNYLDTDTQLMESLAAWSMIPQSLYSQIAANKCIYYWDEVHFPNPNPPICADLYDQAMTLIQNLNIYDLFRTQYDYGGKKHKIFQALRRLQSKLNGTEEPQVGDDLSVLGVYMNRKDVRDAFHIPATLPPWSGCNDPMYTTYQALREGSDWIYDILKAYTQRYRLLHYSGDTDGAVTTLGTRRWIAAQGYEVTGEWRPWTTDGQLSGYLEDYGTFTFATIHGVGHMAPQWKRKDVTLLISKFAHGDTIN